jgi:hypothetical protein
LELFYSSRRSLFRHSRNSHDHQHLYCIPPRRRHFCGSAHSNSPRWCHGTDCSRDIIVQTLCVSFVSLRSAAPANVYWSVVDCSHAQDTAPRAKLQLGPVAVRTVLTPAFPMYLPSKLAACAELPGMVVYGSGGDGVVTPFCECSVPPDMPPIF